MLYELANFLFEEYNLSGSRLFQYISFRAGISFVCATLLLVFTGGPFIRLMKRKGIYEKERSLGLGEKREVVPMGGILIILSMFITLLLFADLTNVYVQLLLFVMLWMGGLGFWDDYIKSVRRDKGGIRGWTKIGGQALMSIVIGTVIFFHPEIKARDTYSSTSPPTEVSQNEVEMQEVSERLVTNIPILKDYRIDYEQIFDSVPLTLIFFLFVVMFITMGVSNGSNLTDGMDGLAAGVSSIIGLVLGVYAWVSSHQVMSSYLGVFYIEGAGEIVIFTAAFTGAMIGFLWYNASPANIFMGDTGSLTIGALISATAFFLKKEWFLPIICGVFLMESVSVILQVGWYKTSRRLFGSPRRLFLMSPLHHHFQKQNIPNTKIIVRFWIVALVFGIVSILLLKLR